MRRLLAPALTTLLGLACADGPPTSTASVRDVPVVHEDTAPSVTVDTIAHDLVVPWGLAWAPDGRLFVTERVGRIRVIHPDGRVSTWAELDAFAEAPGIGPESGLMGLALAPDFRESGHVFVAVTRWRTEGDREGSFIARARRRLGSFVGSARAFRLHDQVVRLTDRDGHGVEETLIVPDLPANHYHAGGGLAFGRDSLLYVTVGDALSPALARDNSTTLGKLLRFTSTGAVPATNPSAGSPVFARGLRNTQAFTWLADGTMLGVDHGPSGMTQEDSRAGDDELNILVKDGDYGWPAVTGAASMIGVLDPIHLWRTAVAPAGIAAWPRATSPDTAFVTIGTLAGRLEILTLVRDRDAWRVSARATSLDGTHGRLRAVVAGPDDALYVSTSNRDARGRAREGDDLIIRLRLAPQRARFRSTAAATPGS